MQMLSRPTGQELGLLERIDRLSRIGQFRIDIRW